MSLISNRHFKVILGSVIVFVIFVFLLGQPSGISSVGNSITKPSKLKNAPDISTPNSVPISNKAPYGKTEGDDDIPVADIDDEINDVAAPKKDDASTPKAATNNDNKNTNNNNNNKIQANKDKAESVEQAKQKGSSTGSSSFGDDSLVQDEDSTGSAGEVEDDFFKDAPKSTEKEAAAAAGSSGECKDKNQFVIMVDAGSTGSRVHVYSFDLCYSPPKLLDEKFKMMKPGLSSFDTDAEGAAKSLDELLDYALEFIPEDMRGCTPLAVKATAGLRLLGEEKSKAILTQVRKHLETDYPFAVVDGDGISMMGGGDEGVYAWITTNYLLGNIGAVEKTPTAAVFDLGGGSTQIVFEPNEGEKMLIGEHKYSINFGSHEYTLYQYSHLGYGLMEGRNKVNSLVLETHLKNNKDLTPITEEQAKDKEAKASVTLTNPCMPPGVVAKDVKVKLDDKTTYLVNFKSSAGEDDPLASSAATQCRFLADSVLNKELECKEESCSFNGVYQPSLLRQFDTANDMFIFSYFYDRLNPLGMPNSFTLEEFKDLTKLVCSGSKFWSQYLIQETSVKELQEEPQWCLDLSFMLALLHTGYDIPLARELKTAKTINNNELGWCLGASLPLLDKDAGGWKCRVKEVAAQA